MHTATTLTVDEALADLSALDPFDALGTEPVHWTDEELQDSIDRAYEARYAPYCDLCSDRHY